MGEIRPLIQLKPESVNRLRKFVIGKFAYVRVTTHQTQFGVNPFTGYSWQIGEISAMQFIHVIGNMALP